jgi:hypothetical protein
MILLVLALIAPTVDAFAEELNLAAASAERPNLLLVRTGLDHAFVLDVGYRRVIEWGGRQLFLGGDLEVPVAGLDAGDFRVRAVAAASLLGGAGRGWKLVGSLGPTLRATQSAGGDEHAVGVDVRLTAGYYARWWCAAELGLDWAAATYVEPSRAYRDVVYADAKAGWYGNPGGTLYAGLNAGVSLGAVDLLLRAGHPRTMALGAQTVPLFVLVGVNVVLPQ